MALKPPSSDVPYSPLIDHPDHVAAIGMISVELGNLETSLGALLGSLLHIDPENGRLIYLSPQAAMGRLAILQNLATDGKNVLKKGSKAARVLDGILKRAKSVIGKRNDFIHHSWGTRYRHDDPNKTEQVASRPMPFKSSSPAKPITLPELEDLLQKIRKVNGDAINMAASNYEWWPPYTSQPKPNAPEADGPRQTPDSPQTGTAPKPKPRPSPSRAKAAK